MYKILRAITSHARICPSTRNTQVLFNPHLCVRQASSREIRPSHREDREEDILMQNLRSSRNVENVLYNINQHHPVMTGFHLKKALQSIFMLQKSRCSSLEIQQLLKSEEFEILCSKLVKKGRTLDVHSALDCLKSLVYLQVPVTSAIMQAFLHLIKHQINDLSLRELKFLTFLCEKLGQDPLVDALKIALPLVFESQYKLKLDKDNLSDLTAMLRFAENPNVSENCFDNILDCIACHPGNLYGKEALQVATAIFNVRHFQENQIPLAHRALSGIVSSINTYRYREIKFLLSNIIKKIQKHRQFYNEQFFDAYVSFAIHEDLIFSEIVWILKTLTAAGHTSISLMDHIAQKVEDDPSLLKNCSKMTIFALPAGFSNANYKPKNWDQIKDLLIENFKHIPSDTSNIPWPKFVLNLASLNCFDDDILKQIFDPSFLETILKKDSLLDHIQLLTLYQAVRILYPEYQGPFPSDKFIENAKEINGENVTEFPLQGALEQAIGGALYVKTKLYSKMGHFIDHAVAVRKGGFAVAINYENTDLAMGTREFIEDLKVPEDSQLVLVLAMPPGSFSRNCKRLRGSLLLKAQTLEAAGHAVVIVSTENWQQMPDYEKIPFLMQQIKLKSSEHFEQITAF